MIYVNYNLLIFTTKFQWLGKILFNTWKWFSRVLFFAAFILKMLFSTGRSFQFLQNKYCFSESRTTRIFSIFLMWGTQDPFPDQVYVEPPSIGSVRAEGLLLQIGPSVSWEELVKAQSKICRHYLNSVWWIICSFLICNAEVKVTTFT